MRIVLYSRPQINHTGAELTALMDALRSAGFDYKVNAAFAQVIRDMAGIEIPAGNCYGDPDPDVGGSDVAVSYGGDGTFLECVKLFGRLSVPVLGINSGRLGFLANVPKSEIRQAFEALKAGHYSVLRSCLLEAAGDFPRTPPYPFAFNEFSLQRSDTGMIAVEAYVDGEMVATYWGDGVILSTPAGSTAYSLSVGGPVVAPECGCFVLSPIAPHNLTMRPVVIPDASEVTLRVASRGRKVFAAMDSDSYETGDGASFTVKKAENSVFLVKLQNISFYDTLRNKMMWGFDRRDQKE